MADVDKIIAASDDLANPETTLRDRFTALEGAYLASKTAANFMALVDSLFEVAREVDTLVGAGAGAVSNADLKADLQA